MSGPLLYAMFKEKTSRPLHAAVRHRREDVLFLYLIEYRAQVTLFHFFFEGLYSQKIKTIAKNFRIKEKENKISHVRGNSLGNISDCLTGCTHDEAMLKDFFLVLRMFFFFGGGGGALDGINILCLVYLNFCASEIFE